MYKFKVFYLIILCLFLTSLFMQAGNNLNTKKIVVVGLNDNVKSNCYYGKMIAEEAGMEEDSIDVGYNRAIMQNMVETSFNIDCRFITMADDGFDNLMKEIVVNGEDENCKADLSAVPTDELQKMLYRADANYILIINKHYLKHQETPMQTVFHFVSYSIFDNEKNEIVSDNYYFTCMHPEHSDKIKKISRKSTSKMTGSLVKVLEKYTLITKN